MNTPSNGCICDLEQPRYFGARPYAAAQGDKRVLRMTIVRSLVHQQVDIQD
jgi:hypothetical protein